MNILPENLIFQVGFNNLSFFREYIKCNSIPLSNLHNYHQDINKSIDDLENILLIIGNGNDTISIPSPANIPSYLVINYIAIEQYNKSSGRRDSLALRIVFNITIDICNYVKSNTYIKSNKLLDLLKTYKS